MTTQCVDDHTMTTHGSLLYPNAEDHQLHQQGLEITGSIAL